MVIVSNSSPLIALADIDQLNLLPDIFDSILIPPAVAAEIAPSIPDLPGWLHVQSLKQALPRPVLNLSVTGTVGVLLVAKRHGLIPRVRPCLDALVTASFFVSTQLYDEVLRLAGEFDQ